jgi:hypothetical protein
MRISHIVCDYCLLKVRISSDTPNNRPVGWVYIVQFNGVSRDFCKDEHLENWLQDGK